MSRTPPQSVEKLQKALHAKAKAAPTYRFYALYDKLYRADVLAYAYACCRANGGAAGVDGQTFEQIEAYGVDKWLDALAQALQKKTYRPQAVRRVYLAKPDGKQRPLGIPTVADRVVQTAALLVLEPIFEADLQPEQYAYRSGRSALEAVRRVQRLVIEGHTEVVDADLSGYFDSIPHAELMKSVARRVSDGALLRLIKSWLEAPVEEEDAGGQKQRTTRNKDQGRGTPQGAPLSPLLANIYMRRFILGWKQLGHQQRLDAYIVNYADDFVICCRGTAQKAEAAMREMMRRLKLTVNEHKTRVCQAWDEPFDFLGYTIGRCYRPQTGTAYIGVKPSAQKVQAVCREIRALTDRRWSWLSLEELVRRLKRKVRGWANYFCMGTLTRAYRRVGNYLSERVRRWWRRKHGGRGVWSSPSWVHLHEQLGPVQLRRCPNRLRWQQA